MRVAMSSVRATNGTLMAKIHRHDSESTELTTHERTDHRGDARVGRPGADRLATLLLVEGPDDDRQRRRRQQRAEDALQRPAGDEHLDRRGDRAQPRDDAEAGDPQDEDALLAEDIAQRAADEDQRA
jgi:hypothetical protein